MGRATLPQQGTRSHRHKCQPSFVFERRRLDKGKSSGQSTQLTHLHRDNQSGCRVLRLTRCRRSRSTPASTAHVAIITSHPTTLIIPPDYPSYFNGMNTNVHADSVHTKAIIANTNNTGSLTIHDNEITHPWEEKTHLHHLPLSWLSERSSSFRAVRLPSSAGMEPSSEE